MRRSGGTRLFRAGVDRKLVKEHTGHQSDAVDAYQVTSHDQRKMMSSVIQGQNVHKVEESKPKVSETVIADSDQREETEKTAHNSLVVEKQNAGEIVSKLLKNVSNKGETTITIKIEIDNE